MNQNRGNQERHRPNLNPNYQNPVDLVRNYNRGRQQEPEENIYERLNDEDEEERNGEARNEPSNQNNVDNHIYERIDDWPCRAHSRYKYQGLNQAGPSFLNDESRNVNHYDQPRHVYLDSSRLSSQFCQNRLGRLGRNCFSTENIAYASSRRSIPSFTFNCMCPFCRHLCHHCHNLHNRLRYQDPSNNAFGNSRHYIYQISRPCRCPFCRGEYYSKFLLNPGRPMESLRIDCHCRNPNACACRSKLLSNSSSMQIGRYLDWINRGGASVNNPLYATIQIGRIDRSCPGNSNPDQGSSNEPGTSNCTVNRSNERQHTCDDSCIRNQSGSFAGICQFLGKCERAECNHGRMSVHWWFVNKWLPYWHNISHYSDSRNVDAVPSMEEEPPEQEESDTDEP